MARDDDRAHGTVAEGFEGVREAFAKVLGEARVSPEAQLVVQVGGRRVVDLWGGPGTAPDRLTSLYSITKGAAHLVVALLVQDGVLDLDREVASYWPEFGAEGKDRLTLRELLAHRSGVVGVDGGFSTAELADDRLMAERLAGQRPFWEPGTAYGYHAFVIGALTGEVVRRVTGRSIQEIYEERTCSAWASRRWTAAIPSSARTPSGTAEQRARSVSRTRTAAWRTRTRAAASASLRGPRRAPRTTGWRRPRCGRPPGIAEVSGVRSLVTTGDPGGTPCSCGTHKGVA
ncbi:serine hydrolase domain-containing protein [Streptomyces sp. 769]|uniref:serine hydrolase domain-containing protein n=1 Tax=Streptomyces sp. 769 TaxID=1262452 RepID=UPI0005821FBC|nr:beta-lactamase class C [Streptomyces sp. 769]